MKRRAAWALLVALTAGCTEERVELLLDLETDLVPGVEFSAVRTELFDHLPTTEARAPDEHTRVLEATRGASWVEPVRIAELSDLEPGRYYARVRLMKKADAPVLQRLAVLTVRETSIFTLTMTRDCRGLSCPADGDDPTHIACVGGRCADPRCTEETPEHCPPPACTDDTECVPSVACAAGRCAGGECLYAAAEEECEGYVWGSPDDGCLRETRVLTGGPGGLVHAYELAVTPDGDVALVGSAVGAVDLGAGAEPAPPVRGMMVARYGPDLGLRWGHVYGATGITEGRATSVSPAGRIQASGYFLGDGTFGTTMLSAGAGQDVLLVELDPAGALLLAEPYPTGRENGQGRGMDVGSDGATAIAGVYGTDLTIGGEPLPPVPASATDWAFVAVLSPPATARWTLHVPGTANVLGDDVAFAEDGGVCAVGRFDPDLTLEGETAASAGLQDGFVARLDPDGTVLWWRTFGGARQDFPYRTLALGGGCVAVGLVSEGAMFEPVAADTRGGSDGFVARWDAEGAVQWVRVLGGADDDHLVALAPGHDGELIVGGTFTGSLELGDDVLEGSGAQGLVAGIGPDGSVRWARAFGGDGGEVVAGVGYDPTTGRVAIASRFDGHTRVGRFETTAASDTDTSLHWFTP